MDKHSYSAEGIILSRRNYGEADRILTIFTKSAGKNRVIAKGVRKISSRKRGSLELFSHIRYFAVYGKGMDILTEVEEKNSFSGWRNDLQRVGIAYHLAEVLERLTPEGQEQHTLFDLLRESYISLKNLDILAVYPFTQNFKIKVLEELGYIEKKEDAPKNIDAFIEDIIDNRLRTKKFLLSTKNVKAGS